MDPKNTMELHSSLQVIFIQIPAYRWSGDLKPQSSLLKSQCIMRQCKQNQNKCTDTHGGMVMWQFGSSSRARTPMDGFHNLKLQSSPQKVNRTAESQAYVQNSTGHFLFRHAYSLENDMHRSWKPKRMSLVTRWGGAGAMSVLCVVFSSPWGP